MSARRRNNPQAPQPYKPVKPSPGALKHGTVETQIRGAGLESGKQGAHSRLAVRDLVQSRSLGLGFRVSGLGLGDLAMGHESRASFLGLFACDTGVHDLWTSGRGPKHPKNSDFRTKARQGPRYSEQLRVQLAWLVFAGAKLVVWFTYLSRGLPRASARVEHFSTLHPESRSSPQSCQQPLGLGCPVVTFFSFLTSQVRF